MDANFATMGRLRSVWEYVGILKPRPCPPFRFLDLPTEIRLLIYEELFGGARAHMVHGWEQRSTDRIVSCQPHDSGEKERVHGQLFHLDHDDTSCRFQSAVLRSCKTVYEEALPVLYANPIFNITILQEEIGTLSILNATHIRRLATKAWWLKSLKEQEIAEGYQLAGIRWNHLWLFAIDIGHGLGSGLAPDGSAKLVSRPITLRPPPPIEYDASDVEWLFMTRSASELKNLGVCFRSYPECWYVKKGSIALRDRSPKAPKNYVAHGSRLYVIQYPWASS